MTNGNIPETDTIDVQPDLNTIRMFEVNDERFRVYLTRSGQIACDRYDAKREEWLHLALRAISEAELNEILSVRYTADDEEIARILALHQC